MNTYDPGNTITLSVTFTNTAASPVDPTTVTLRVLDPTGVEIDYTGGALTKASVGNYSCAVQVVTVGNWYYRWEGTGAVYAANETGFIVSGSAFNSPN